MAIFVKLHVLNVSPVNYCVNDSFFESALSGVLLKSMFKEKHKYDCKGGSEYVLSYNKVTDISQKHSDGQSTHLCKYRVRTWCRRLFFPCVAFIG